MSPCVAETARTFTDGTGLMVYQSEGRSILDLPKPCVIWVTIGLADAQAIQTQGAYTMYYPTHCIVVASVSDGYAQCIDPLVGCVDYPLDDVVQAYTQLGEQAVYVGRE